MCTAWVRVSVAIEDARVGIAVHLRSMCIAWVGLAVSGGDHVCCLGWVSIVRVAWVGLLSHVGRTCIDALGSHLGWGLRCRVDVHVLAQC
jgi:hypothetical protein